MQPHMREPVRFQRPLSLHRGNRIRGNLHQAIQTLKHPSADRTIRFLNSFMRNTLANYSIRLLLRHYMCSFHSSPEDSAILNFLRIFHSIYNSLVRKYLGKSPSVSSDESKQNPSSTNLLAKEYFLRPHSNYRFIIRFTAFYGQGMQSYRQYPIKQLPTHMQGNRNIHKKNSCVIQRHSSLTMILSPV